ncbi:4'-phosphopantetheinyl transferase family protein [Singulisphaera acidiphila]|uniref:Phosphopantetheinyl transferase n=1 Tax=Singulisphaera acidiphila (strain ATCC BAA-1392 / DSM 18658 / VKM B-2454 / MOB10) TaxID=886293 RepID=L0DCM8_SINAD|nr:4'-phosphopantetheinyl transferase superfamily protein [Singulisphaera acidiphila]AGA27134.1 phosphopantetheinyl transferase [Singulisphaera acidiphila DSM 18658]
MTHQLRPNDRDETLGPDDVHVWMASLEQGEAEVARLRTLLDEPERKRADRYSFEKGRRQFTVARGLLRILLGRYLRIEPTQVQFAYNAHGKPALAEAHRPNLVRFNISHSGEVALFGFANERELGIDLETIRPDFAADAIAARFFAPAELASIRSLPPEDRTQAFFTCWTRKEAYIKAQGKGLALSLDSFEVSLAPGAPAAVLVTHDDREEAARWSLHELHPGPGYVGALAVAGEGCRVRVRTWQGLTT